MDTSRRLAPVALALLYPLFIWAGPAISPAALALALAIPALAGYLAWTGRAESFASQWLAHLAFASPALYTLAGVLFDFRSGAFIRSGTAYTIFWLGGAAWAFAARSREGRLIGSPSARLAKAHGFAAIPIAIFGVAHLVNHLAGFVSGDLHISVMSSLRTVYRQPAVEVLLLACIAFQSVTGLVLVKRRLAAPARSEVETVQSLTGVFLIFFLASHLTAVLTSHYLRGVDTNFTWLTASNLLTHPWSARLAPYYFLAVVAFAGHGGAGIAKVIRIRTGNQRLSRQTLQWSVAVGTVCGAFIMASLLP